MTINELLAREILRLDARDPLDERDKRNDEAWPSGAAVAVAVRVVHDADQVAGRWAARGTRAA